MLNRDYQKDILSKFKIANDRISLAKINPSAQNVKCARETVMEFEVSISEYLKHQEAQIKIAKQKKTSISSMMKELDSL